MLIYQGAAAGWSTYLWSQVEYIVSDLAQASQKQIPLHWEGEREGVKDNGGHLGALLNE